MKPLNRLPILSLLYPILLCAALAAPAQEMPIVGYQGVRAEASTAERYREMRRCGFNVNVAFFTSSAPLLQALDAAQAAGMRLIPYSPATLEGKPDVLRRVVAHPAFLYYMLGDEPDCFFPLSSFASQRERLLSIAPGTPVYANLSPLYGPDSPVLQRHASYESYLLDCDTTLQSPILSFDFYPVVQTAQGSLALRPTWLPNLRAIRRYALRAAKPFWGFVLATPHAIYPQPTMAHLRLQVYANLLFGAKGIQYYTYWTPEREPQYDYHDGPLARDGSRTPTYRLVRQMNQELLRVAPLFMEGEVASVDVWSQTQRTAQAPFQGISLQGGEALACHLRRGGADYVIIQNHSLEASLTVTLQAPSAFRRVSKRLQEGAARKTTAVAPGDVLILRRK